jgi:hypothetical protein
MGNRRLYKIEHFYTLGTSKSERLKVTALNLFHPTASPRLPKDRFLYVATQPLEGGGPAYRQAGRGTISIKHLTGKPRPLGRGTSLHEILLILYLTNKISTYSITQRLKIKKGFPC